MYNNWYAVQVRNGNENEIVRKCEILLDKNILNECFIPRCKRLKKFKGKWIIQEETLFKGYVFMITNHVDELYNELKKIPELTKLLGKDNEDIFPIYEQEVEYLLSFGGKKHVVEMSSGYIQKGKIYITKGPLIGEEGNIKKIDRHKRIAYVEVSLFGQVTTVQVGLEIVSKD